RACDNCALQALPPNFVKHALSLEKKEQTRIPKIIIQTSKNLPESALSWILANPAYSYMYFDDTQMMGTLIRYLRTVSNDNTWIVSFLKKLSKREKNDLFRYIAVYEYGGIYADSDVQCLVPIEEWLLRYHVLDQADMIVGIEHTQTMYSNPFQLVQSTFAATAHNPILRRMIDTYIHLISKEQSFDLRYSENKGAIIFTRTILMYVIEHSPKSDKSLVGKHITRSSSFSLLDDLQYPNDIISPMNLLDEFGQFLTCKDDNNTVSLSILPFRAFGINSHSLQPFASISPRAQQLAQAVL
ncbi:hypothetical protein RFI_08854, partial [Reticulomyxa filosa]